MFVALASLSMLGASCGNKSSADPDEAKDVVTAMDGANAKPAEGPKTPIPGVDLGNLDERGKEAFHELANSLPSPCGKAHSLRTSVTTDESCKRALYAARYVAYLLGDEYDADEVRELYAARYKNKKLYKFKLEGVPHTGPADAGVVLVEFFDYGCPACRHVTVWFHELLAEYPNDLVLYYKQFPISYHVNARPAAQAALAAHAQGKYEEMHELLFARQGRHSKADLWGYAKQLGLDMAKFSADFDKVAPRVMSEYDEGDKADVGGTPTIYINGRMYDAPLSFGILKRWIEEERAIRR